MEAMSKVRGYVPPQNTAQPREVMRKETLCSERPERKKVFTIRTHEGKRIEFQSPHIRITPNPSGFVLVESFELGVWSQELTTPYPFELAMREV